MISLIFLITEKQFQYTVPLYYVYLVTWNLEDQLVQNKQTIVGPWVDLFVFFYFEFLNVIS